MVTKTESDRLELPGQSFEHVEAQGPFQLVASDLDANDIAVMADPALTETEGAQNGFSAVDHLELLLCYRRSIRYPRGQAGRSGLVPGFETPLPRQSANLGLRQAGLDQRTADRQLATRGTAGTVVPRIVKIVAVGYVTKTPIQRHLRQPGVQLVLAEVATIDRVPGVVRIGEFLGSDELVPNPEAAHDLQRDFPLICRIAGTFGGDGKGLAAEFSLGDDGKIGTVDAAAERHQTGTHLRQDMPEAVFFLSKLSGHGYRLGSHAQERIRHCISIEKNIGAELPPVPLPRHEIHVSLSTRIRWAVHRKTP